MLSLNTVKQDTEKSLAKEKALEEYLGSGLMALYGKKYLSARRMASGMAGKSDLNRFDMEQVQKARQDIKKELKVFGFQEKLAYYSDAQVPSSPHEESKAWMKRIGAFAAVGVVAALTKEPAVMVASALIFAKPVMSAVNEEITAAKAHSFQEFGELREKTNLRSADYAQLKHAHLLLKKLENALMKKECKEMTREAYRKGIVFPPATHFLSGGR